MTKKSFELGQVLITQGIKEILDKNPILQITLDIHLESYQACSWGITNKDDRALNDKAVISNNDRIMAVYMLDDDIKIWIITEWDRSVTTVLLPDEY
jgi:hypothetical protein